MNFWNNVLHFHTFIQYAWKKVLLKKLELLCLFYSYLCPLYMPHIPSMHGNLARKLNSWPWKTRTLYTTLTYILWNISSQHKSMKGARGEAHLASETKVSCINHNMGFQRSCSGLVQNVFLVQRSLGSVKSLLTLKWTRRFYPRQLVTFSLFHHWWPWIQSSLLASGHQRLQRQSCEHFGFATDHLTLGRPACGEL